MKYKLSLPTLNRTALIAVALLLIMGSCRERLVTPLEKSDFTEITSHEDMMQYVGEAASVSPNISLEIIGHTHQEREIPALKISSGEFGADPSKVRVMIFSMLHGNEQSAKEGALLLVNAFANRELNRFLRDIDLIVVPLVNADGAEVNRRQNAQGLDLNRDHVLLMAPENRALHALFNRYLPEVTVDVHEYFPYGANWERFGYRKDFDMQIGLVTNPNISEQIIRFQNDIMLPFMQDYIESRNYSFHNYLVGGIPGQSVTRHSTVDINDGRQSLGIQNSFSMIYEGINGRDRYAYNIDRRAKCQYESMVGLLEFVKENKSEIRSMVNEGRDALVNAVEGEPVAIRTEYIRGDSPLHMPLKSVSTGADTVLVVEEYYPIVDVIYEVERPAAYLIPAADTMLKGILDRHDITYSEQFSTEGYTISGYLVSEPGEEPEKREITTLPDGVQYLYVPSAQLKANMLVIALEPYSETGLINHPSFRYLTDSREYPVLRLESR